MTTILLLLFLAPEPAKPLDSLQWLVEGQWESKAKLPSGRQIESRTVWDWGPGRYSMRGRIYIRQNGKEYLQYESILFWNKDRIEYLSFSLQGRVIRGVGRIEKSTLILEQPATKPFPPMRSTYTPDPKNKDRYEGKNFWKQEDGWREVMLAVQQRQPRKPLAAVETKAPAATRLAPLRPFLGEWVIGIEIPGEQLVHQRLEVKASLHGGLQCETTWDEKVRFAEVWTYFDPGTQKLQLLGLAHYGQVVESVLTIQKDRIVNTVPGKIRTIRTWTNKDLFEARSERREKTVWIAENYLATCRRLKK